MPKLYTLITVGVLLTVACVSTQQQPEQTNLRLSPFVQETLGVLHVTSESLDALSDDDFAHLSQAEQEVLYSRLEENTRAKIQQIANTEIPQRYFEVEQSVLSLLSKERDIWIHMTLFTRTGDELHRILANELLVDSLQDLNNTAAHLEAALERDGIDTTELGLAQYAIAASPTPQVAASLQAPTATPIPTATPSPTTIPESTSTPWPIQTASPTAVPTLTTVLTIESSPTTISIMSASTSPPIPMPTPSPVPTSTPAPTFTPYPIPTPVAKEGELVVIRYPDSKGNPAFIAHWTVNVDPNEMAVVEYPFEAQDRLEISMFMSMFEPDTALKETYIQAPGGERLVEFEDFAKSWRGETIAPEGGTYGLYFDNTDDSRHKVMHVLITYHNAAPGAVIPNR